MQRLWVSNGLLAGFLDSPQIPHILKLKMVLMRMSYVTILKIILKSILSSKMSFEPVLDQKL